MVAYLLFFLHQGITISITHDRIGVTVGYRRDDGREFIETRICAGVEPSFRQVIFMLYI